MANFPAEILMTHFEEVEDEVATTIMLID